MKFKFLVFLTLLTFTLNSSLADEDGSKDISFYAGTFDVIDKEGDDQTSLLGIEHRNLQLLTKEGSAEQAAFLIRNLIGVDPNNGAVAVAEKVRPGQQVQFQLREANSSRQEALQLLQAEEYHDSQLFENIQSNMMQGKDICLTVTIDKTVDGKYPDTCISELHFVAGMN